MKKNIAVLLIALVFVTSAFAAGTLTVQFTPFAYTKEINKDVAADKGIGADIGLSYPIKDTDFGYGVEINFRSYKNDDTSKVSDVSAMFTANVKMPVSENSSINYIAKGKVGFSFLNRDELQLITPSLALELGLACELGNSTKLNVVVEGMISPNKRGEKMFYYGRVCPAIGISHAY